MAELRSLATACSNAAGRVTLLHSSEHLLANENCLYMIVIRKRQLEPPSQTACGAITVTELTFI